MRAGFKAAEGGGAEDHQADDQEAQEARPARTIGVPNQWARTPSGSAPSGISPQAVMQTLVTRPCSASGVAS